MPRANACREPDLARGSLRVHDAFFPALELNGDDVARAIEIDVVRVALLEHVFDALERLVREREVTLFVHQGAQHTVTGPVAPASPVAPPVPLLPHVPGFVLIAVATALRAEGVDVHVPLVVIDASGDPTQLGIE